MPPYEMPLLLREIELRSRPKECGEETWDVLICALGYESRARFVAEKYGSRARERISIAFDSKDIYDYRLNEKIFQKLDFFCLRFDIDLIEKTLMEMLVSIWNDKTEADLAVCVDISSMSRPMLAKIIWLLSTLVGSLKINVTFLYAPALYANDIREIGPILYSAPVLPEFAGWSARPDAPLAAIIGLGCEDDFAMGALENLEAATARVFAPSGESVEYDRAVNEANDILLRSLNEDYVYIYDVKRPDLCFNILDRLVFSFIGDRRVVILPFGPKVFGLIAIFTAINFYPDVTVWRVSGAHRAVPLNRTASGRMIRLDVTFTPSKRS